MKLEEAQPQMAVAYVPMHANGDLGHKDIEDGRVSSIGERFVFVKFNKQVSRFGWDGTTSQACKPEDLVKR